MDSHQQETGQENKAWLAFLECSEALEHAQLAVELRSRSRDEESAFSGDYDYLMDSSRFNEIALTFFRVCVAHGVSFQIRHRAAFKHRIYIFHADGRSILFEFWPHAELTTDSLDNGWSYLTYQRFLKACEAGFKEETLALLYVCHLFFKRKDLVSPQVQWRLEDFTHRMGGRVNQGGEHASFSSEIRQLFKRIIDKELILSEANQEALNLLVSRDIQVENCRAAKWSKLRTIAARPFRGWGGKIVPCVGPDGSGKTYFIAAVMDRVNERSLNATSTRFKRLFRKNKIYSLISKRYRSGRDMPKNVADEQLASFLYWVSLPAYMWQILKSLNKKAVFMDRFFLEFMVRGYRDGEQGIKQIAGYSILSRLIPEPRRMIVLTADQGLITSRKTDLSPEAIEDFYSRYLSYALDQKVASVLFLNSRRPGDELAECCLKSFGMVEKTKP